VANATISGRLAYFGDLCTVVSLYCKDTSYLSICCYVIAKSGDIPYTIFLLFRNVFENHKVRINHTFCSRKPSQQNNV